MSKDLSAVLDIGSDAEAHAMPHTHDKECDWYVGKPCDCLPEADAENDLRALRDALTKLSNEVLASLPLMEPLARREFGNTNYAILIQRAEEARAILAETAR